MHIITEAYSNPAYTVSSCLFLKFDMFLAIKYRSTVNIRGLRNSLELQYRLLVMKKKIERDYHVYFFVFSSKQPGNKNYYFNFAIYHYLTATIASKCQIDVAVGFFGQHNAQ